MLQLSGQAQIRDVVWSNPIKHPCYKGLTISVLNMGWSNDTKTYLWGVRIKNNYSTAVSFRYLLTVGNEKKDATINYFDAAYKLKPGDTVFNGANVVTGIIFNDPSPDWTVIVGNVCFDGMRCGGSDNCYADCDVSERKINQACGLSSSTSPNDPINEIEPSAASGTQTASSKKEEEKTGMGETTNWLRDDKKVEIEMSKTEKGIYWRRKGDKEYTYFFKVPGGNYRYENEKVFYLLQFVSETKVNFLDNGAAINYYTLLAADVEAKNDDFAISNNSEWKISSSNNARHIITLTHDGLIRCEKGVPSGSFYKKISEKEYEKVLPNGRKLIHEFINSAKFVLKNNKPGEETRETNFELITSEASESKIKNLVQSVPSIDINGKWNYNGINLYNELNLIINGDLLLATFSFPGYSTNTPAAYKNLPYKKIHQYFYTYYTDTTKSILRYLNDTTVSISYQYKNLNTLSYFTRSVTPVVKQENKPAPVTENKSSEIFECLDCNTGETKIRHVKLFAGGLILSLGDWSQKFTIVSQDIYKCIFTNSCGVWCQTTGKIGCPAELIKFIDKDKFLYQYLDCDGGKVEYQHIYQRK